MINGAGIKDKEKLINYCVEENCSENLLQFDCVYVYSSVSSLLDTFPLNFLSEFGYFM